MAERELTECLRKTLRLRPVMKEDYETLLDMRRECGWGEERLEKTFLSPARPTLMLVAQLPGGQEVNVGMAGLTLEDEGDGMSSREEGKVQIVALCVLKQYQGFGVGSLSVTLLERYAVEEYNARILTLDTTAYQLHRAEHTLWLVEDESKRNPVWDMYNRRGYEDWGVPEPIHPNGDGPPFHLIRMRKVLQAT